MAFFHAAVPQPPKSHYKVYGSVRFQGGCSIQQPSYCLFHLKTGSCFIGRTCCCPLFFNARRSVPSLQVFVGSSILYQATALKNHIKISEKKALNNLVYSKLESRFPVDFQKQHSYGVSIWRVIAFALFAVVTGMLLLYIRSVRKIVRFSLPPLSLNNNE